VSTLFCLLFGPNRIQTVGDFIYRLNVSFKLSFKPKSDLKPNQYAKVVTMQFSFKPNVKPKFRSNFGFKLGLKPKLGLKLKLIIAFQF